MNLGPNFANSLSSTLKHKRKSFKFCLKFVFSRLQCRITKINNKVFEITCLSLKVSQKQRLFYLQVTNQSVNFDSHIDLITLRFYVKSRKTSFIPLTTTTSIALALPIRMTSAHVNFIRRAAVSSRRAHSLFKSNLTLSRQFQTMTTTCAGFRVERDTFGKQRFYVKTRLKFKNCHFLQLLESVRFDVW